MDDGAPMNESWRHGIKHLKEDYRRCSGATRFYFRFLFHPGFQVCCLHRLSHLFFCWGWTPLAQGVLVWMRWSTGCDIHYNTELGPGISFPHGRGVIIGEGCRLGSRCTLFQHVTLGASEMVSGAPTLMEGVNLYPGVVVVGPVEIGEYCRVGPNVYLTESTPSHTRVRPPAPELYRKEPK
jgi:serine O-acetyltransferase